MTRVAIVVLNWNGADDAMACMDSLRAQTVPTDIILVDNDSHDNSVEMLDKYIASHQEVSIHFIKNGVNSGFTGGNNVGFRYALKQKYDYIGTLNPDATADPKWVEQLIEELEAHSGTGIATGILARSDHEHVDTTGDFYTTWGIPSPRGRDSRLADVPKQSEYVFGSTGGGFIMKHEVLERVGFFDEKFFMYFEDVDFCFRTQLKGYKIRYTPSAIAYHKLSASTNKVPGLAIHNTFKNLPMVFLKNVPLGLWWVVLPRFVLTYVLILGHAIIGGRGGPALKGWLMSIVYLPHSLWQRHRIQASRQVGTKYISSIIVHDIPPEQSGLRKFRSVFIWSKK